MSERHPLSPYGMDERIRAAGMTENDLRMRVDLLLEQCGREITAPPLTPRGGMLHVSEIFFLLGLGPVPGAEKLAELGRMIEEADGS